MTPVLHFMNKSMKITRSRARSRALQQLLYSLAGAREGARVLAAGRSKLSVGSSKLPVGKSKRVVVRYRLPVRRSKLPVLRRKLSVLKSILLFGRSELFVDSIPRAARVSREDIPRFARDIYPRAPRGNNRNNAGSPESIVIHLSTINYNTYL